MLRRAIASALAALLLGACVSAAPTPTAQPASQTPAQPSSMAVSLGIYSGRPDPSWTLTDEQIAEFGRLVEPLPTAVGDPPAGGLGYHGFYVLVSEPGQADRTLVAYRGFIADSGSGPRTFWQDAERTVEAYLLETGRPHLTANVIAAVEADLGLPK